MFTTTVDRIICFNHSFSILLCYTHSLLCSKEFQYMKILRGIIMNNGFVDTNAVVDMNNAVVDTTNTTTASSSVWYNDIQMNDVEVEKCIKIISYDNGTTVRKKKYYQAIKIKDKHISEMTYKDVRKVCNILKVRGYKNKRKHVLLELIACKKLNIQYINDDNVSKNMIEYNNADDDDDDDDQVSINHHNYNGNEVVHELAQTLDFNAFVDTTTNSTTRTVVPSVWYDNLQMSDVVVKECVQIVENNNGTLIKKKYYQVIKIKDKLISDMNCKVVRSICRILKVHGYKNNKKHIMFQLIALKKMNIQYNNINDVIIEYNNNINNNDIVTANLDTNNNIIDMTDMNDNNIILPLSSTNNNHNTSKKKKYKKKKRNDDDHDDDDDQVSYNDANNHNNTTTINNNVRIMNSRLKYEIIEYNHHYNISIDVPGIKMNDIQLYIIKEKKIRIVAKRYINKYLIKQHNQILVFDNNEIINNNGNNGNDNSNSKNHDNIIDFNNIIKCILEYGILILIIGKKIPNEPKNIIIQTDELLVPTSNNNNNNDNHHVALTLDLPGVRLNDVKVTLYEHKNEIHIDAIRRSRGANGTTATPTNNNTIHKIITIDDTKYNMKHVKAYLIDGVLTITVPYNNRQTLLDIADAHDDDNNVNMSNKRSIPIMLPSTSNNMNDDLDDDDDHDDTHNDKKLNPGEEVLEDDNDDTHKNKKHRIEEVVVE